MFTGIVQGVGRVRSVEPHGGDVTLWFDTGEVSLAGIELGGSLPVVGNDRHDFVASGRFSWRF